MHTIFLSFIYERVKNGKVEFPVRDWDLRHGLCVPHIPSHILEPNNDHICLQQVQVADVRINLYAWLFMPSSIRKLKFHQGYEDDVDDGGIPDAANSFIPTVYSH